MSDFVSFEMADPEDCRRAVFVGPDVTVIVVRVKVRGHWHFHARQGHLGRPGMGEPVPGSDSFSEAATTNRARRFAMRRAAEYYTRLRQAGA